jgi:hypothetical protein
MEKEKKRKKEKKCVRSAHVGALDGAARAVAWSDRTLKWFCAMALSFNRKYRAISFK